MCAYTETSVNYICILQSRLKACAVVPTGIVECARILQEYAGTQSSKFSVWNCCEGKCHGRKQPIDLEKENKPFAKCRRHREKNPKNDRISKDLTDALTASVPTGECMK